MTDWPARLQFDMAFAERVLVDAGEVGAMATLHCGDATHLIAMDVSTDAQKARSLKMIRLLAIVHEAEAIGTMGEMWQRSVYRQHGETDAEHYARARSLRAADSEDRREVVMVQLYYRDDEGTVRELSQAREIIRDAAGKPTGLAPSEEYVIEFSEGVLTQLMPPTRPTAEQVRYARDLLKRVGVSGTPLRTRH